MSSVLTKCFYALQLMIQNASTKTGLWQMQQTSKNFAAVFRSCRKNITGDFGGYISKSQPIGVYELKKSIATLPFLKKEMLEFKSKPSHQLAHVVNRMFTTLESKVLYGPHLKSCSCQQMTTRRTCEPATTPTFTELNCCSSFHWFSGHFQIDLHKSG